MRLRDDNVSVLVMNEISDQPFRGDQHLADPPLRAVHLARVAPIGRSAPRAAKDRFHKRSDVRRLIDGSARRRLRFLDSCLIQLIYQ